MVTTFVRLAGSRSKNVWCLIEMASRLVETEHPSLKKALSYCARWAFVYVQSSFYWALKLKYPLDGGGVSRDGRVTTELSTGSLTQTVDILTPRISMP